MIKDVFIYALLDPRNNYVRYIGKANNPNERYRNHYNPSRDKNTHKRNWIDILRKDGLRPELLVLDKVSINEWQFWECFYISLYKSYGFDLVNYTSGGDGSTFGNKGSFKKGQIPHNKGVPCSEKVKEKIRNTLLGTSNVSSYKKIIQYDLNYNLIKKYKCVKDAIDESNGVFSASKISNCCTGKRTNHRGFIWKYDDGLDIDRLKINVKSKSVIKFDKNLKELDRYESIKEASNKTNIKSSNICACCKGKMKTSGGYIWKYL